MQSCQCLEPWWHGDTPSRTVSANSTVLCATCARVHNYPTDANLFPGEWQTGREAPRGCPGRILLLSGFATNRHTLLHSEPMWDTLVSATQALSTVGAVASTHACGAGTHSPSWQYTRCAGLPRHTGWGNSESCFGFSSDAFLGRHLGWSGSRNTQISKNNRVWRLGDHSTNLRQLCVVLKQLYIYSLPRREASTTPEVPARKLFSPSFQASFPGEQPCF